MKDTDRIRVNIPREMNQLLKVVAEMMKVKRDTLIKYILNEWTGEHVKRKNDREVRVEGVDREDIVKAISRLNISGGEKE